MLPFQNFRNQSFPFNSMNNPVYFFQPALCIPIQTTHLQYFLPYLLGSEKSQVKNKWSLLPMAHTQNLQSAEADKPHLESLSAVGSLSSKANQHINKSLIRNHIMTPN